MAGRNWTLLMLPMKMLAAVAAVVWASGLEKSSSIVLGFVDCWERAMVKLLLSLLGSP